jgi:hypothetical protein
MKRMGTMVSMLVLAGSLAGTALAEDGLLVKEQLAQGYCHMKFPAIKQGTLAGNNPQLKDSSTGDVIDFYGPCNETPTSKDQVDAQKLDEARHFSLNYGG